MCTVHTHDAKVVMPCKKNKTKKDSQMSSVTKPRFRKFPSIEQFRKVVKEVRRTAQNYLAEDGSFRQDPSRPKPTLVFHGTVKLHGTNAGVGFHSGLLPWAQSRTRILGLGKALDNLGFCAFVNDNGDALQTLCDEIPHVETDIVYIFGEWCGKGVQTKVAIAELDKRFVTFAALVVHTADNDSESWIVDPTLLGKLEAPEHNIYSIYNFASHTVEIDFETPQSVQTQLEEITALVEAECPVGKHFGVSGVGEGVVWTCQSQQPKLYTASGAPLRFKVKGDKHAVTKCKRGAAVAPDVHPSIRAFVESVVTESRLEQALGQVFSGDEKPSKRGMGRFIAWVADDVVKEESDTMQASDLDQTCAIKYVKKAAAVWLVKKTTSATDDASAKKTEETNE